MKAYENQSKGDSFYEDLLVVLNKHAAQGGNSFADALWGASRLLHTIVSTAEESITDKAFARTIRDGTRRLVDEMLSDRALH